MPAAVVRNKTRRVKAAVSAGLRPERKRLGRLDRVARQSSDLNGSSKTHAIVLPGFPARGTRERSVCGFLRGKPHGARDVTYLHRKSGVQPEKASPAFWGF